MKHLEINCQLLKSFGRYEFILGLTHDPSYRSTLVEATGITPIEDWEPYELEINEKSRFIIALEYEHADLEDDFREKKEYSGVYLHLYEYSFEKACHLLGKLQLLGDARRVLGFSLLSESESLASRLEIGDEGGGWDE
jgi:hypothetical protein